MISITTPMYDVTFTYNDNYFFIDTLGQGVVRDIMFLFDNKNIYLESWCTLVPMYELGFVVFCVNCDGYYEMIKYK